MSCESVQQFRCKPLAETPWLEFDFSDQLGVGEILTGTPQAEVTLLAGVDPNPGATKINDPIIATGGRIVQVQMGLGVVGNSYLWTVTATRQSTGLPVVATGYITVT